MRLTNPKVRLYIYAVAGAALLVLLAYGLLAPDKLPVWANLLTAILGIVPPALAIPNVPKQSIPEVPASVPPSA